MKNYIKLLFCWLLCRDPIPPELSWTILFPTWNAHCDSPGDSVYKGGNGIVLRQILKKFP